MHKWNVSSGLARTHCCVSKSQASKIPCRHFQSSISVLDESVQAAPQARPSAHVERQRDTVDAIRNLSARSSRRSTSGSPDQNAAQKTNSERAPGAIDLRAAGAAAPKDGPQRFRILRVNSKLPMNLPLLPDRAPPGAAGIPSKTRSAAFAVDEPQSTGRRPASANGRSTFPGGRTPFQGGRPTMKVGGARNGDRLVPRGGKFADKVSSGKRDKNVKPKSGSWAEALADREPTQAEEEYKYQKMLKASDPIAWNPQKVSMDELYGLGPAIPVGEFGMAETLLEHMRTLEPRTGLDGDLRAEDLCKRLFRGDFVHFRSDVEKRDVLALAHKLTMSKKAGGAKDSETAALADYEFESLTAERRAAWENDLLQGKYRTVGESKPKGLLGEVVHLIRKNETYTDQNESAILKKLGNLMPASRLAAKTSASETVKK